MCSVLTIPFLVLTFVPSTIGNKSRWTPSRDVRGSLLFRVRRSCRSRRERLCRRSRSYRLPFARSVPYRPGFPALLGPGSRALRRSLFFTSRTVLEGNILPNMSLKLTPISSMPWPPTKSIVAPPRSWVSISIRRSSRSPRRSWSRSFPTSGYLIFLQAAAWFRRHRRPDRNYRNLKGVTGYREFSLRRFLQPWLVLRQKPLDGSYPQPHRSVP